MNVIDADILIVLLLIAANGLFAMAEIAIVSVRKTRLRKLAEQGDAPTFMIQRADDDPINAGRIMGSPGHGGWMIDRDKARLLKCLSR